MSLFFWWVAMFLLGLVAMGLCYLFLIGCEKI
jgi:VIT1/CCC1 family predicted Fe2+/Mn2+ transporter